MGQLYCFMCVTIKLFVMDKKLVTLIVPCYNETAALSYLYAELQRVTAELSGYRWEFLFINDGSKDDTLMQIEALSKQDERVSYIDLARNFGKENAMLAGFDYAQGDCAILMDADLQDPPSLIDEMLLCWEEGYDDVYARRRNRGKESWLRKMFSLTFYKILNKSTRFDVLENVGDFRLLDRKCILALQRLRESERYTKGLFCWIGFRKKEIIFDRADREHGESHWSFWQLFSLAIEGIVSFTTAPLRLATILGSMVAFFAICFLMWVILKALIWGDPVAGYPSLLSVILFLGATQLIAIGILGEYIGRIFLQTKERPVYLIREYHSRIKLEEDKTEAE